MAPPFYLILALLIQCSLSYADVQSQKNETESIEISSESDDVQITPNDDGILERESCDDEKIENSNENDTISKTDDDLLIKDFRTATNDWVDTFLGSGSNLYPSSSASLMAQATNSNKSPEEQLEEIKEVATEITMAIQNEMTNLLSYALNFGDKDAVDNNNNRKKRSIETPMDSSQLVMKLLNHIKCSNDHQSAAIEKMMSAQEIANKFNIEFNPDPEILSDLAFAANEQAKELTSILEEACGRNSTSVVETITDTTNKDSEINISDNIPIDNKTYYVFSTQNLDDEAQSKVHADSYGHEHSLHPTNNIPTNHIHYSDNHAGYNYYSYPYETQIPSPPVQYSYGASVSPKPTFYDSISYNPNEYYLPYCSVDQMPYPPFYPLEETLEPELVGEEYEETVSSRLIIEQDEEPGSATVNHVMTYTVSEKAHFRTPQIEKLPEQMQYYFFLL